jgi:lipopolysaccharide transport system ATP-binding protein
MTNIAIRVENLSKQYRIGQREPYKALRDILTDAMYAPFRRLLSHQPSPTSQESNYIWALKDVSFEIKHGEIVGIIGRNGAGKTTLLKVLSRITEPNEGMAEIHGRVGSLLEVGTGFHPELTGRENIYLNGAILGMKKAEIERKFDEIVAFAEIEKFLDTPVKRYSSGMYVRLAFSVAAHLDPEILLVDEVLAVGDAAFQKKCLGKMDEVAKEGRTILFVSHNMVAVQSLCTRTIWLNYGKIVEDGQSDKIVKNYLGTSYSTLTEQVWDAIDIAPGNEKVRLHRACVRPNSGSSLDPITIRTPLVIEFEYWNLEPGAYLTLSLVLYNDQGVVVFNSMNINEPIWNNRPFPVGLFRSECHIPGDLLNNGTYRVELLVIKNQGAIRDLNFHFTDILVFEVHDTIEMRKFWYGKWLGTVRPNLEWHTELIN